MLHQLSAQWLYSFDDIKAESSLMCDSSLMHDLTLISHAHITRILFFLFSSPSEARLMRGSIFTKLKTNIGANSIINTT